jgi:secreted trypsin-like serine protease
MNFKSVLTLILSGCMVACAPDKKGLPYSLKLDQSENIIGGQDLGRSQKLNTSVVAILTFGISGIQICTGTFISKNIILTAAHCVSTDPSDVAIHFSNSIFESDVNLKLNPLKILIHPDYVQGKNDLALIQIKNDQNISISPVSIASDSDLKRKSGFTLFGYGVNRIGDTENSNDDLGAGNLRQLKISSQYISQRESKFIIDQSHGFGACHGDSGGPAFLTNSENKYVLAGVASGVRQSANQADCAGQSQYTDVSKFQTWILQSISDFNRN